MLKNKMINELSQSFPRELVEDLITSYEKVLTEYRKGLWEETLWKTGKFAENVFRFLGFLLTKKVKKEVPNFRDIKEKLENTPSEQLPESIRILIPRITSSMIYDPRSKKAAIHVKPINPDYMDASLGVSACSWILAELIRLYHTSDPKKIVEIINSLIQRKVPFIELHGEEKFVTKPLGCDNEILLLLLDSPDGLSRTKLGKLLGKHYAQSTITESIQKLTKNRFILLKLDRKYIISGPGEKVINNVLNQFL